MSKTTARWVGRRVSIRRRSALAKPKMIEVVSPEGAVRGRFANA